MASRKHKLLIGAWRIAAMLLLPLAFTQPAFAAPKPIDLVPMYGGMDRSKEPELKQGDERFIADVVAKFGTREKASAAWVDQGFRFQQADDDDTAMRRFNQAWLLDPNNPGAFHGFAAVLFDKGDTCGAMKMSERALTLGLDTPDFLADAALAYSLCAVQQKRAPMAQRTALAKKSDELFETAAGKAPKMAYVYDKWWRALFVRGESMQAWKQVFAMRAAGGEPAARDLDQLRSMVAEPKPKPAETSR
jgi:hypothetical protein